MNGYKTEISDYIDGKRDEMINVLRTLVKIPSYQGDPHPGMPFGEEPVKALSAVLQICRAMGFNIKNIDNYMGIADLCPTDKEPGLGILCHLDIVPEGEGWTFPPYELTEINGRLYGRGAINNKGPAVAAIYAARAVLDLGIPLESGVRLIFGTNEENGSCDLIYYRAVEKMPPAVFTPDGSYPLINSEKGMIRVDITESRKSPSSDTGVKIHLIKGGNAVNAVPERAEATLSGITPEQLQEIAGNGAYSAEFEIFSRYNLTRIIAKGRSAHASTPENGRNAVTALLSLLAKAVPEFVQAVNLSGVFPDGETDGKSMGLSSTEGVTAVLSVINYDGKSFQAKADIRFSLGKTSGEIAEALYNTLKEKSLRMSVMISEEPHYVPEDSGLIKNLLAVYEDVTGEKGGCKAIGGGTYVHGIEGGVAFGPEFPGERNNMHSADEFISVESFLLNAKIYANAITEICAVKEKTEDVQI